MLDAGGGSSGISGDPGVLREAAGMLETNSTLGEDVPESIESGRSLALSGWSAPSAQGFTAFSSQARSAAAALVDVGAAAAAPLRTYADALEAAQCDFAQAKQDFESASERFGEAERGSRAEREAEGDLEQAETAMGNARQAALAANQRAAQEIGALTGTLPVVPAGPEPPAPPPPPPEEEDKPWWSDAGHLVLDGVGLVPVLGEPADGVNALWYAAEGDELNAGLSAAGMVPFLGWGATGAKLGIKGAKAGDEVASAADEVTPVFGPITRDQHLANLRQQAETAGVPVPEAGMTIHRTYGEVPTGHGVQGGSGPFGASWSPAPIDSFGNPRGSLGLPHFNGGRYVVQGTLHDPAAVSEVRRALPWDGPNGYHADGGAPEYLVPNSRDHVSVDEIGGVNPDY